jgi:hypothetical protein
MSLREVYTRHCHTARQERALLSAIRLGIGDKMPEWASRLTASGYGVASALTLDEFALWLDLHDDYWDQQGRKSIDAVALFGGLLTIGVAGRGMLNELGLFPKRISELVERDEARRQARR